MSGGKKKKKRLKTPRNEQRGDGFQSGVQGLVVTCLEPVGVLEESPAPSWVGKVAQGSARMGRDVGNPMGQPHGEKLGSRVDVGPALRSFSQDAFRRSLRSSLAGGV